MFRLTKQVTIEAAHCLPRHKGKCRDLHGHSWEVEVTLYADELDNNGMVADFGQVKELVNRYDHRYLNEIPPFDKLQPTSERLAQEIATQCAKKWPHLSNVRVSICETDGSELEYSLDLEI